MIDLPPGPWKVYDTGEAYRPFAIYAGEHCIADVNSMDEAVVLPIERRIADAIAALPDVVNVCRWLVRELCEAWDQTPETAIPAKYREALAKAGV